MTRKFEIHKAVPCDTFAKIALVGPAGSGKTFSALRLAKGFGGRTVVIDTENRRSAKYSSRFDFHMIDFQPPFNPDSYGAAIDAALAAGAETIIIDSMSHEHEGEGGVLEMAEDFLDKRAGNDFKKRDSLKFASWIGPKRERTRLIVNKIQRVPANIILCFRAKEVTKPVRNEQGKVEPIKEWDMIGGDEYRYEMDVTIFLPSGSEGVPDWRNPMRRVNDADGNLKSFLIGAGQINEDVGRQIKMLNGPGAAPTEPEADTQQQAIKAAAQGIVAAINAAVDEGELYNIIDSSHRDDWELTKQNPTTHDFLKTKYEQKKASFDV